MRHQFIEDNLVVLSRQTIQAFLECDYPDDLIALYVFYYYTAKWQKTNCIKATRSFVIKGLKWGKNRFSRAHKKLAELGLIESVIRKDTGGKMQGHYVRVKYLWKHESLIFEPKKPQAPKADNGKTNKKTTSTKNHLVDCPTAGKQGHKCFNCNKRNASSVNKEMLTSKALRLAEYLLLKIIKRKPDFKKPNLKKWVIHVDRMIRLDHRRPETIERVIDWCQQDGFWQNNILCTEKLRKQFDKLELQMKKNGKSENQKTRQRFRDQRSAWGITIKN